MGTNRRTWGGPGFETLPGKRKEDASRDGKGTKREKVVPETAARRLSQGFGCSAATNKQLGQKWSVTNQNGSDAFVGPAPPEV